MNHGLLLTLKGGVLSSESEAIPFFLHLVAGSTRRLVQTRLRAWASLDGAALGCILLGLLVLLLGGHLPCWDRSAPL